VRDGGKRYFKNFGHKPQERTYFAQVFQIIICLCLVGPMIDWIGIAQMLGLMEEYEYSGYDAFIRGIKHQVPKSRKNDSNDDQ